MWQVYSHLSNLFVYLKMSGIFSITLSNCRFQVNLHSLIVAGIIWPG
jgi:hypothetical protein